MLQPLFASLISIPGLIILPFTLGVIASAALMVAIRYLSSKPSATHRRKMTALWMVLGLQATAFTAALLASAGAIESRLVLPPLTLFITALSVAWLLWAWLQAGPDRLLDAGLWVTLAAAVALLALTYISWRRESNQFSFNDTWLFIYWELFLLAVVIMGGILLLIRRPAAWQVGVAFTSIQFAGIMADLFFNHSLQDFSIPLRLAQLAAFPLAIALPRREQADAPTPVPSPGRPVTRERRRYATDQKTFLAALRLASESRPDQLTAGITRFISHMMVADLAFLLTAPDDTHEIIIEGGFDLVNEEALPGVSIQAGYIPDITEALHSGTPLRILKGSQVSPDLLAVADALDLNETGSLMLIPLVHEVNGALGGLLLLSAYSQRLWSQADEEYIQPGAALLAQVLQKRILHAGGELAGSRDAASPDHSRAFFASIIEPGSAPVGHDGTPEASSIRETIENLRDENQRLLAALETARSGGDSPAPTRQQLHELEEALYYAYLRIEELEKANPAPATLPAAITLPALIEPALVEASMLTGHKHVTMRIDIPLNLPALQAEPGALQEVLTLALQKALEDTAAEGTIVLKAQAGAASPGSAHVHLKVISSGTPVKDAPPAASQAALIEKATAIMSAQAGKLWVDPLAGGALVTNVIMPAVPVQAVQSTASEADPNLPREIASE